MSHRIRKFSYFAYDAFSVKDGMNYSLPKLFFTIILTIFLGELVTMLFIRGYTDAYFPIMLAAVDASLLTCLVFPVLYFFHHKPLKNSIDRIIQVEKSLRVNENKFQKIFNNSPLGISLLSQDWKYLDINPAMEKIVGFTKAELLGNTPAMITHQDFVEKNLQAFDELTAGKRSHYSFEKKYIRKDGEEIWCKLSVSLYSIDETETAPFVIAMMEDITKRRRVQKKLRESQAMLSEAEKLAGIGHWHWHQESGVETWSDQMCRIMGFQLNCAAPGEDELETIYSADEWAKLVNCRERVFKSGISKTTEVTLRDKREEKAHLLVNIRPELDHSGKITGLFGTFQDITPLKRTEERLKEAKKEAEEATKLKNKFISLVAHDLRSPSISNTNLIKHILKDKNSPAPGEHREILNKILLSCQKMNMLVKDVLNIARLKTGSLRLNKKYVKARELVDQVLTGLILQTNSKKVNFLNKIPEETLIFVDTQLLSQVVENLLTNALKFSFEGGTVNIFQPETKGEISIAIRDSGTGITDETLNHIFSYESGASVEGTAGETGTGLGLPLSKEIVQPMEAILKLRQKQAQEVSSA